MEDKEDKDINEVFDNIKNTLQEIVQVLKEDKGVN